MISSETVKLQRRNFNLVIFFRSSVFFCESSDFCKKDCGNTNADILAGNTARQWLLMAISRDAGER